MTPYQPSYLIGYHACDKEIGMRILQGNDDLNSSTNPWDWLGHGAYFWEQDVMRAAQYAYETAAGMQRNKNGIKVPFVLGAIIDPGNCLNLVESRAMPVLSRAYEMINNIYHLSGKLLPTNKEKIRFLDCAVMNYVHVMNQQEHRPPYDTIRCAFPEGEAIYPGSMISSRLHIQICVCNPACIKGFFVPRPITEYSSHLKTA
ncbi:hypothetical protein [Hufsiella ginkgonis]|uniref:Uncharacterized protein n=1 Tax=Hufsiella ginkgonis TaxID=2695274 RepID=A0A7K1XV81_9SPHI|nr:hypothetical protein [Hufsiella ginkgonis]MXV14416.1 hypothetical protein [Hufsiella ginkgonis]